MAILTGPEIRRQIEDKNIVVEPFDPQFIGPNSIDLHLGTKMLVYKRGGHRVPVVQTVEPYGRFYAINAMAPPPTEDVPLTHHDAWLLVPGRVYLAATQEYTETRGFVPYVDGRSSMGRLGLFCHVTAGRGDNGFRGNWTLELVAVEPILVYPGQRIAQLTFHTIEGAPAYYGETGNTSGRYQGHREPTPAVLHPAE